MEHGAAQRKPGKLNSIEQSRWRKIKLFGAGTMRKRMTGILVVIWMAVIFLFSAQPAWQSAKTSHSAAYKIAEWQNQLFGGDKTEEELAAQAESMQFVIRKGAHMGEYALLAVLLCFHFTYYSIGRRKKVLLAVGITACYAASDEIHQIFVPGRAGRFTDVCIDTLGGVLGIAFFLLALHFCRKNQDSFCKFSGCTGKSH